MIIKGTTLHIVQGNILKQEVEAIVNAANSFLEGGGGVDGMIHLAAGPKMLEACRLYKKKHNISRIEVGDAIITESFGIRSITPKIHFVIHTVGPNCNISSQNKVKEKLLQKAYLNSLERAREMNIHSVAFPAISTGIYSYPFKEAQIVAMNTIADYLERWPGLCRRWNGKMVSQRYSQHG